MLYKYNVYLKQVKKYEEDNALSDDEVVQLDIKTKIQNELNGKSIKISQELLSEAFQWRLRQNDCQNRGYVLDGYPICY